MNFCVSIPLRLITNTKLQDHVCKYGSYFPQIRGSRGQICPYPDCKMGEGTVEERVSESSEREKKKVAEMPGGVQLPQGAWLSLGVCMHVHACTCVCVCAVACVHASVCTCVCKCVHVCAFVCMCVCMCVAGRGLVD